jgi:hypothetical protein
MNGRVSLLTVALSAVIIGCSPQANTASVVDDPSAATAESGTGGYMNVAARPAPRREKASPTSALRFDPAVIADGNGQERPMAASTMLIPHGWHTEGPGVVWGQQFLCTDGFNFNWRAVSPDGSTMIGLLPQAGWGNDNTGHGQTLKLGCTKQPFNDVRSYLQAVVQSMWPQARILDFRRRPEFEIRDTMTPMVAGEAHTRQDAGEILFAFSQNGRDMRGSITVAVNFAISRMPVQGMGDLQFLTAAAQPGYIVTAPNGQLNLPLYGALQKTIQPNPQWVALMGAYISRLRRGEQIEQQKRQQVWHETTDAIARLRAETWNANQASSDRRAAEFGEVLRGVQSYRDTDASGGRVELSNSYNNAWRLSDGSYVLSNDVNFEPGRDLGVDGRKLEAGR